MKHLLQIMENEKALLIYLKERVSFADAERMLANFQNAIASWQQECVQQQQHETQLEHVLKIAKEHDIDPHDLLCYMRKMQSKL